MNMRLKCALAAAIVAGGCAPPSYPPVRLDATDIGPRVDYSDLAAVLKDTWDSDDALIAAMIAHRQASLNAQLKLLAATGPGSTPKLFASRAERLAYWYNVRTAWSLKLALLAKFPDRLPAAALTDRPFPVDGRHMTLAAIDKVLAEDTDWRTVVAAPGVSRLRARLPRTPFEADDILRRIHERFVAFVDDDEHFPIDAEARALRIPPVLWQFRGKLIAEYNTRFDTTGATLTTALLPYVSGSAERRLQDAIGYVCVEARDQGKVDCRFED